MARGEGASSRRTLAEGFEAGVPQLAVDGCLRVAIQGAKQFTAKRYYQVMLYIRRYIATIYLIATSSLAASQPVAPEQVLAGLYQAFNAHDPSTMGRWVAENVQWLSVDGASIAVEAEGKAALIAGMADYFAALPSVRSETEQVMQSGRYVTVREHVSWTGSDGAGRSQSALAVYEIDESVVLRVWYFPAEP